jgi:hypothetical protein
LRVEALAGRFHGVGKAAAEQGKKLRRDVPKEACTPAGRFPETSARRSLQTPSDCVVSKASVVSVKKPHTLYHQQYAFRCKNHETGIFFCIIKKNATFAPWKNLAACNHSKKNAKM